MYEIRYDSGIGVEMAGEVGRAAVGREGGGRDGDGRGGAGRGGDGREGGEGQASGNAGHGLHACSVARREAVLVLLEVGMIHERGVSDGSEVRWE